MEEEDKRSNADKVRDLFDKINTTTNKEFITTYCAKRETQIFEIDLATSKFKNDKQNNKNQNIVFQANLIKYSHEEGYSYTNIKDVLLIAPANTFFRMLREGGIGNDDFVNKKVYRIMFKVVSQKKYKFVNAKEIAFIEDISKTDI